MAYPDQIYAGPGNWDDPYVSPLGQVIRQTAPVPTTGQNVKHALAVAALSRIPFVGRQLANRADETWQRSMPTGQYPWDEKLPDGTDPNAIPPRYENWGKGLIAGLKKIAMGL